MPSQKYKQCMYKNVKSVYLSEYRRSYEQSRHLNSDHQLSHVIHVANQTPLKENIFEYVHTSLKTKYEIAFKKLKMKTFALNQSDQNL